MGAGLNAGAGAAKAGRRGPLVDTTSCQPPVTSASRPALVLATGIEGTAGAGGEEASCRASSQLWPPPRS